jgi:hypothetical protein
MRLMQCTVSSSSGTARRTGGALAPPPLGAGGPARMAGRSRRALLAPAGRQRPAVDLAGLQADLRALDQQTCPRRRTAQSAPALRHTVATRLAREHGRDLALVADILGDADLKSTRDDVRSDLAKRRAALEDLGEVTAQIRRCAADPGVAGTRELCPDSTIWAQWSAARTGIAARVRESADGRAPVVSCVSGPPTSCLCTASTSSIGVAFLLFVRSRRLGYASGDARSSSFAHVGRFDQDRRVCLDATAPLRPRWATPLQTRYAPAKTGS